MFSLATVLSLFIPILKASLALGKVKGWPQDVLDALSNGITELSKVQGSDVTKGQLDSLAVTPQWQ